MKKNRILFFSLIISYIILTPGFLCGPGPQENCSNSIKDTAIFPFNIPNNNTSFHVLDTIKLISAVSDTIHSIKGKSFLNPLNFLSSSISLYKVVNTGSGAVLNYANIEFNPLVLEGQFLNNGDLEIQYNRVLPYNRLQASLVPGSPGLYLVTLDNNYSYGYQITEPNNHCDIYYGAFFIPENQQQKQYWDSLGTTSLMLAGTNGYEVANKNNRNCFFVKILP
ncbi:hypothetical protein BH11BAC4_BH11BAC4_13920 [soil metagenome]